MDTKDTNKNKSVAIVGFSELTSQLTWDSTASEIWSVNNAYDYNLPPLTRLFEIHPLSYLESIQNELARKHLKFLKKSHDFRIYMLDDLVKLRTNVKGLPVFPSAEPYPMDKVINNIFANLLRDGKPQPYLTSSIAYMIALAIYEGFEKIELYGIELKSETEYTYQRANAEMLCGVAMGRGIEVHIPQVTGMFRSKLYHKGGQQLERSYLEKHAGLYLEFHEEQLASAKKLVGSYDKMIATGETGDHVLAEQMRLAGAQFNTTLAMGAYQSIKVILDQTKGQIGRQFLEKHRLIYKSQQAEALARANWHEGYIEALGEGAEAEKIQQAFNQGNEWQLVSVGASGSQQAMASLIEALDYDTDIKDAIKLTNEFQQGAGLLYGDDAPIVREEEPVK